MSLYDVFYGNIQCQVIFYSPAVDVNSTSHIFFLPGHELNCKHGNVR